MKASKWLPWMGLCACLGAGCLGGGAYLGQNRPDDRWPLTDTQVVADGTPAGLSLALTGYNGRRYPPPRRNRGRASSAKTVSIEAGLGASFDHDEVSYLEGVVKSEGRAAFSGYIQRMRHGDIFDYDLSLISPGLELCFVNSLGVGGPFLRLGLVMVSVELDEPDAELEKDSVIWYDVRWGCRACIGGFVTSFQTYAALGEKYTMTRTVEFAPGIFSYLSHHRELDVGFIMTVGAAF